jgi:hypothetical protein
MVEEYAKQETSVKQVASGIHGVISQKIKLFKLKLA